MLKIAELSQVNQAKHLDAMAARLKAGKAKEAKFVAANKTYDAGLLRFLDLIRPEILTGSPDALETVVAAVSVLFPDFSDYLANRSAKSKKIPLHEHTLSLVNAYFNYDWFSRQTEGWGAYALVEAHNIRICPYCHANHVNYHLAQPTSSGQLFQMRPPLDHYLPKSLYPYLAVSLSNLIPSCTQCNSSIKTAANPLEHGLAHPLDPTLTLDVTFSAVGSVPSTAAKKVSDIKLTVNATNGHSCAQVNTFRLQQRYEWYRHEVKDLFDRHGKYRQIPATLKSLLCEELFVLGFAESTAEQRATGLCLRDIYRELIAGTVV